MIAPGAARDRSLVVTRVCLSLIFFINGAGFANWVARIPEIQRGLNLSEAALGMALFCIAGGSLLAMPLVGGLVGRMGSSPLTAILGVAFCGSLALPALASSFGWLALTLAILGACTGGMDVAMNAQAAAVEKRWDGPIMTSFHALYSSGGLIGALVGSAFVQAQVAPAWHLSIVAAILAIGALAASTRLLDARADTSAGGAMFALPSRALTPLAIVAFCVLLGEGAMADWTAVYMVKENGGDQATAALGFGAFSLMMAAGRFAGDLLTRRFGPERVVRTGALIAAIGLGLGLMINHPYASLAAFGAVGAGFSCIFPNVLSAAARARAMAPGAAIAAVATAGYAGFLAGPPVIGFIAQLSSLTIAMAIIALLAVAVVVLSRHVAK
jgi:fucose permease